MNNITDWRESRKMHKSHQNRGNAEKEQKSTEKRANITKNEKKEEKWDKNASLMNECPTHTFQSTFSTY